MKNVLTGLLGVAWLGVTTTACAETAMPKSAPFTYYTYQVVASYPHNPDAFTQGLFFHEGELYETTGQYGESSLRKVDIETGEAIKKIDLPAHYFGEGSVSWDEQIIALTWRAGTGLIFNDEDMTLAETFSYSGEGWGLTHDGKRLIMSDGTATLRFLDPESYDEAGSLEVSFRGKPLHRLNELEWVNGEIFANVWQTNAIARIDPSTGRVTGMIDMRGILPAEEAAAARADVLNGIAYDEETDRLFVTGKYWPKLYQIELTPREDK